jgi:hypothetical protein
MIFVQAFGNNREKAKIKIIPAEKYFQKASGILIKIVEAFNNKVKIVIEAAKDKVTIIGLFIDFESAPPPTITGKRGRTQGAKIVKIPAINDIGSNSIKLFYISQNIL